MTLPEILCDPLIQAVMAADGVNPRDFATELRRVALALPHQPTADAHVEYHHAC